jgi:hypothetical protein
MLAYSWLILIVLAGGSGIIRGLWRARKAPSSGATDAKPVVVPLVDTPTAQPDAEHTPR